MKKKYIKPEMICITMTTNMMLAGSPTGVNSSYSTSDPLSRDDGDNDW